MTGAGGGIVFLDRRGEAGIERLLAQMGVEAQSGAGQRLICIACGHAITEPRQAMAVAGQHRHRLTNPAGVTFNVGCFRDAPGCRQFGEPTGAHSWFPGCFWRFAVCRACGEHLGWAYSGAECFFGLIVNRLRRADDNRE